MLDATKLANLLKMIRDQIDETTLTSWTCDRQYESALSTLQEEQVKCRIAEMRLGKLWLDSYLWTAATVCACIVAAIMLMVFADFMQAVLDTAVSTGRVASACGSSDNPPASSA